MPQAVYNSLSSGEQEFYQQGNTLYTVGGYSVPDTINFTGNTTAGSDVIPVSSTEGLAIGQYVTGSTIPNKSGTNKWDYRLGDHDNDYRDRHQHDHYRDVGLIDNWHGYRGRIDGLHEQLHDLRHTDIHQY